MPLLLVIVLHSLKGLIAYATILYAIATCSHNAPTLRPLRPAAIGGVSLAGVKCCFLRRLSFAPVVQNMELCTCILVRTRQKPQEEWLHLSAGQLLPRHDEPQETVSQALFIDIFVKNCRISHDCKLRRAVRPAYPP